MTPRAAAGAGAWFAALTLAACLATAPSKPSDAPATQPGGGGATAAPGRDGEAGKATDDEGFASPVVGDELTALDARVDQAWSELQALDEAPQPTAAGTPGEAAAKCDRIRGLADEICTLGDRVCTLATEHPGQPRYADACARAGETCRQARQAAERCPTA